MYVPERFQNNEAHFLKNTIRQSSFGVPVSQRTNKMSATHIPLELSIDETKHLGRDDAGQVVFMTTVYMGIIAILAGISSWQAEKEDVSAPITFLTTYTKSLILPLHFKIDLRNHKSLNRQGLFEDN